MLMICTILNIFSVVHGPAQFIECKDYLLDVAGGCGLPASIHAACVMPAWLLLGGRDFWPVLGMSRMACATVRACCGRMTAIAAVDPASTGYRGPGGTAGTGWPSSKPRNQ